MGLRGWVLSAAMVLAGTSVPGRSAADDDFERRQRAFPRVRGAFEAQEDALAKAFTEKGLSFPPKAIFLRAFKLENELELWVSAGDGFSLFRRYPICQASGEPGPKRQQGDGQVPEGFYHVDRFNPASNFHLSLGLSYPNDSDAKLGVRGKLGGDIFIHGSCVSIGCLAITDRRIEEVYVLAVLARSRGQLRIPVHVFPGRMDDEGMKALERFAKERPELASFWTNLREGFRWFEEKRRVPRVSTDSEGRYVFR